MQTERLSNKYTAEKAAFHTALAEFESKRYSIEELKKIPSVINGFTFFASEKWQIASDKPGSGNTANIGSIKYIDDILAGNGVFAKAGEEMFDDYWANFGKIQIETKAGTRKAMTSFDEYIEYRSLSAKIKNPKVSSRGGKK